MNRLNRLRSFRLDRVLCSLAVIVCFIVLAVAARAQFETRTTFPVSGVSAPSNIAIGDFNHDGKLDLAVTGDVLTILLGKGDGTFQPPITYPGVFYSIVAADFNNDGNLDLVVAPFSNNITIFLGNGDGTFQSPIASPTTGPLGSLVTGDFNGDHKVDVAAVGNSYISVLLGNGDGTFQSPVNNTSFVAPGQLAVGDFNNDHRLDVVAVGSFGSSFYMGVLLGNGDGTLQDSLTYPLAGTPCSVAAADFNRDGNLDVAIGSCGDLTVLLGNGDGSFQPSQTYFGGGRPVIVGDFNGDGKLDVIAGAAVGPGVAEFLGNGDGTFQPATISLTGSGVLAVAGDLNEDRKLDAVLLDDFPGTLTTMLNTGVVTFSPSAPITFPTQLIGTTSGPASATLTNNGSSPLTISSIGYSGAPFHMQTTCHGSVAPGGSCTITATFTPQAKDVTTGTVTLHDSASFKPQVVELMGTGTVVKLVPRQMNFAPQKNGTTSPPKKFRLTNTDTVPLDISSIYINGNDPRDFFESNNCPASLKAGSSCTISVVFAPRKTGPLSDFVQITDTGGGSPQTVPLSGTGD